MVQTRDFSGGLSFRSLIDKFIVIIGDSSIEKKTVHHLINIGVPVWVGQDVEGGVEVVEHLHNQTRPR